MIHSLFDCQVCEGSYPHSKVERVAFAGMEFFVCNGCSTQGQEALELDNATDGMDVREVLPIEPDRRRKPAHVFRFSGLLRVLGMSRAASGV